LYDPIVTVIWRSPERHFFIPEEAYTPKIANNLNIRKDIKAL
jgi:hypothetical protein